MSDFVLDIDGATPLDPNETDGLLLPHLQTLQQLNRVEQANIQSALVWLQYMRTKDVLTEHFICLLHKKMFADVWAWAGKFRKTNKNIGCDKHMISIELRQLLDNARYWIGHGIYSEIEIAARFHHLLVSIHPFPNGNGRHARIMTNVMLSEVMRREPIDWAGGSMEQIQQRRQQYIHALRAADRGDYALLVAFMCD